MLGKKLMFTAVAVGTTVLLLLPSLTVAATRDTTRHQPIWGKFFQT